MDAVLPEVDSRRGQLVAVNIQTQRLLGTAIDVVVDAVDTRIGIEGEGRPLESMLALSSCSSRIGIKP
jgi:hypothetical protein